VFFLPGGGISGYNQERLVPTMTDSELSKLHDEINELTVGALNRSLPQWMDENMTDEQLSEYFVCVEKMLEQTNHPIKRLLAIHTCPHDIRLMALKQVLRDTTQ
jgi:hypothetical protein